MLQNSSISRISTKWDAALLSICHCADCILWWPVWRCQVECDAGHQRSSSRSNDPELLWGHKTPQGSLGLGLSCFPFTIPYILNWGLTVCRVVCLPKSLSCTHNVAYNFESWSIYQSRVSMKLPMKLCYLLDRLLVLTDTTTPSSPAWEIKAGLNYHGSGEQKPLDIALKKEYTTRKKTQCFLPRKDYGMCQVLADNISFRLWASHSSTCQAPVCWLQQTNLVPAEWGRAGDRRHSQR